MSNPDPATRPNAPSRVITQAVACDWRAAVALAGDPARLPEWASGLAHGRLHKEAGPSADGTAHWRVSTPAGEALLRFAPPNGFGVLDHWVRPLPAGAEADSAGAAGAAEVYMPFRVIATGDGRCELQITLLRQPGMDAAAFERDAEWIARDLASLRALLEAH